MRLRLTDENWQWLRSTDQYAALFRATEVAYNNATLLRPKSLVSLADSQRFNMRVLAKDAVLSADYSKFSFTRVEKDVATPADKQHVNMRVLAKDYVAPADYSKFSFTRVEKDAATPADKQQVNMRVLAKDTIVAADYSKFSFTRVEKDVATSADKQMFSFSYINKDVVNLSERLSFDVLFGVVTEFATSVDVLWSHFTTAQRSSAAPADFARFQFIAGVSDSVVTGEFCSFALSFLLKSPAATVDFVRCTFQAGLFDSVAGADRVSVTISTLVRDSVTAASGFFLSGRAFQNTASSVAVTDAFYSTFTDPQPDSVGASDFIEIGIRYVVDFYFGGMSFGGSPFGGRTI